MNQFYDKNAIILYCLDLNHQKLNSHIPSNWFLQRFMKKNEAMVIADFKFVICHFVNDPTYKNVEGKHRFILPNIFSKHMLLLDTISPFSSMKTI